MAILGKERWDVWELVYDSIKGLEEIFAEDPTDIVHKELLKVYGQYVENLCEAIDRNKRIVWSNFAVPGTLLRGFDEDEIFWYQFEALPVIQSLVGLPNEVNARMVDAAEAAGMAPEVCSVDRIALGSVLEKCIPWGAAAFYMTTPCDSQTCLVNDMVAQHDLPTIVVDMPYRHGPEQVSYVASQFREVIGFLENSLGIRFDWGRLKKSSELYNEMMELILEWVDMRRLNPVPQGCETLSLMAAVVTVFSGKQQGVDYARAMLTDLKDRLGRGERATGEYEIRAVWYGDPMWSDLNFYNWLERELNVTVPMDMFGYYAPVGLIDTGSETGMLEGIARNAMRNFPMTRQLLGSMEDYIEDYVNLCRFYEADFGVYPGHLGCAHAWGAFGTLSKVSREINIPLLSFEFDMLDPRITPLEDLQRLFTQFVSEIVLPRKGL
jgi:hypothetical protein